MVGVRENNPNWKGGRHISSHGYVKIYIGRNHPLADSKGYAYEHRLVLAKRLGRKPLRNEIGHHGDEDKTNNLENNIELKNGNADHFFSHRKSQDLRKPGEVNPEIECACGCGSHLMKFDDSNRPRSFISGHNTEKKKRLLCKCGCGQTVKTIGREYVQNHWSRRHHILGQNKEILCACGCGVSLMEYDKWGRKRKYITGHNGRKFMEGRWNPCKEQRSPI